MAAAATLPHDNLLPRPPGGLGPGAALALLAHAGLLLALTQATDWRMQPPEVVSAELWAAVPQAAAPQAELASPPVPQPVREPVPQPVPQPAPQPAPPPRAAPLPPAVVKAEPPPQADADIATERAEKRKAEREQRRAVEAEKERVRVTQAQAQAQLQAQRKADAERLQAAETDRTAKAEKKRREDTRELLADEARLAEQRAENLRRMMGQAGPGNTAATGSPGNRGAAAQDAAPSAAYSGRLVALIRANTVFTGTVPANAVAEVEVRAAASGIVLSRRLLKSSGHADWDEDVLRAIDRTGRLPRDTDGRVPPVIIIAFKAGD